MNKISLFRTFAALVLLGGLFSCSDAGGKTTSQASDGSASSVLSTDSDAIQVSFWHTFNKTSAGYLEKKIAAFEQLVSDNDHVKVQITATQAGGYSDIMSKIQKGFAIGDVPTMAVAYPDHVAEYLAMEDTPGQYVVDLSKYASNADYGFGKEAWIGDGDASDFVPAFYDEGQHFIRSGMYTMPFMKSTEVMFYNKDMLAVAAPLYDANLNSTAKIDKFMKTITWDQFLDLAQVVKDHKTEIANSLETPIFYDSDANLFISKAYQNNAGYLSIGTDGKGSVDFDNAANRTMVTGLKTAYDKGLLTTKGVVGHYGSTDFTSYKTLFSIGSSGGADYQMPEANTFPVGICPVPASNSNPLYVTQGPSLALLKNSKKSDAENEKAVLYAWKFIKYLTSAEVNSYMCVVGSSGYVPVRTSAYQTAMYQEFLDNVDNDPIPINAKVVINDISGHYLTTPCFRGSAIARDSVGALVTQFLSGNKDIDTAFKDAVNAVKTAM
jgi:ABC-type glycerol-3-phosphate transport system substrate-binding protein